MQRQRTDSPTFPARILLIEDDPEQSSIITMGLTECGMEVAAEATFDDGCARGLSKEFDVIVLDVLLPGGSGFDLCARLRAANVATPVLMLTAKDTVDDRVHGLDVGADDYLTKPYAFRELVARIRALDRRPSLTVPEVITVADLNVDLRAHRVTRAGRPIELTEKEFALLEVFARRQGQLLNRESISLHVWGENFNVFSNLLEVLVGRLRRKIDDGSTVKLIHTLRGSGYRLAVEE
jgi:two-component system copper resistance phosphate regulon response regulator CusR